MGLPHKEATVLARQGFQKICLQKGRKMYNNVLKYCITILGIVKGVTRRRSALEPSRL